MIHNVELPETTYETLKEILRSQMLLLTAAVSKKNISKGECKDYLREHGISDKRSNNIIEWIWNVDERHENLEGFAKGPIEQKKSLARRLEDETLVLLNEPKGLILPMPNKYQWQRKGAAFLRRFYHDFSKYGLPSCLFTESEKSIFNRQSFLDAFIHRNKELHVCPVCDASGFYTSSKDVIYSDVEHYLPQSWYPHFSCHPYNLVPICHLCNSSVHGSIDPLQPDKHKPDHRLPLEHIMLPYRGKDLGSVSYLDVAFDTPHGSTAFIKLRPRHKSSDSELNEQIKTFSRVYRIPERWNEHLGVDKVGETLFRRMRQFLRGTYELTASEHLESVLLDALDQFLYYLQEKERGDYGKDPFAFAMTWLLVAIMAEEEKHLEETDNHEKLANDQLFSSSLIREVAGWLGKDIKSKDDYVKIAKLLRKIISERTSV